MSPYRRFAVPLALAAALQGCATAGTTPVVDPVAAGTTTGIAVPGELLSSHGGYLAAWNADDPARLAEFFVPDAHVVAGPDSFHGQAQITRWLSRTLPVMSDVEARPDAFTRVGEEISERGSVRYTVSPPGGMPASQTGSYTTVWTRGSDGAGGSAPSPSSRRRGPREGEDEEGPGERSPGPSSSSPAGVYLARSRTAAASIRTFAASGERAASGPSWVASVFSAVRRAAPVARSARVRAARTAVTRAAGSALPRSSWSTYARATAKLAGHSNFGWPCAFR